MIKYFVTVDQWKLNTDRKPVQVSHVRPFFTPFKTFSPPHCMGRITPSRTWTLLCHKYHCVKGTSSSWLDGSWIYNYLCNQCLSEFEFRSDEVYSIQHYMIKFVSDLRQVGGFLRVLQFPPPIKLTIVIYLNYCWKWH